MEDIKIKPLTKEQLIISVDRLTRFKHPKIKYNRVFADIIAHNLISPQLKKTDLNNIPINELKYIIENIINKSIINLGGCDFNDDKINKKIDEYEQKIFILDEDTKLLLKNNINYKGIVEILDNNIVPNLQWLRALDNDENIITLRQKYKFKYPIEKLILVEGATEETLLPEFGKLCDYDFNSNGVYIIAAGGKNQVVKLYYELCQEIKIPIFVLLDKDGKENAELINHRLRLIDKIHIINCGEFEDMLSLELIKRTLDYALKNISNIEYELLNNVESRVKLLENIFKTRGLHEFKKVEFAQLIKENLNGKCDLTPEIREIIYQIKEIKTGY